ncbi:methyltransferase domain-containing protein [Rhodoferax sp.]|uniref:methyltransferase domain-containing protein n=1 Tax=Rhodoferax sp. TaxID=50421 RepID=UPI0019EB6F71|nr:methyltransferase domain-containing protein [Rhodoferax sp.]MBE0475319.1 methyltransferase domain-containing protein [Rhodoferax sp.]
MNKENRITQYQQNYFSQYGFEAAMVKYRRKLVMERLAAIRPKTVLEVGCGAELLYQHHVQAAGPVERWIVVEPGQEFHQVAASSGLPNLLAIQGFFEDVTSQIKDQLGTPPDLIIISSVLHEVAQPLKLLEAAKSLMDERSVLHVNVPNAASFHRLLARSMGLIDDVKQLSERNLHLLQHRVYDRQSIRSDVEAAGLLPVAQGGYFIKPFTHAQMALVAEQLGAAVLDGLYAMGKERPELASEIYIEARRPA